MIGKQLAHYEVVHQLGKGGMGEVYQARDTKLGRDVALKLLPEEVSRDPERLARFRREAKLLAALNHPNIGALYGIEEADGRVFLVMELAEGEDLSVRLQRGPIPVGEALALGLQITEGLEAAHAKGIVHRDLKPANVMLSPSGRIKLLDFGLARAYHGEEASGDPMMSPTITAAMTQQGMILGTAAYMSPEQARGKAVDRQSDIWAFGVLLYEMLTGHRLFEGETISDSIGAILHKGAEWNRLPVDTPPQVQQLLRRCLERDREQRLHDIADARVAIIEAQRDPTGSSLGLSGGQIVPASPRRGWALVAATAVVGLALGAVIGPRLFAEDPDAPYRVFDLGVEFTPANSQDDGIQATIAPDGHAVAYTHLGRIWVQELDELRPRELDESEDAFAPFWSPDSTQLGWFQRGRIWKVDARGGRPVSICEVAGQVAGGVGAHWGEDGRIAFTTGSSGIRTVSALGGQPRELVEPGEGFGDLHEPWVLPGDQGILLVSHPTGLGPVVLELWRDGERRVLFEGQTGARLWAPCFDRSGYVLFRMTRSEVTEGLWAAPFDTGSGTLRGEPFLVQPDASEATVADDGTLVFVANPRRSNTMVISRTDWSGARREVIVPSHQGDLQFARSPDGRRIAFIAEPPDGGTGQLWVRDLARGTDTRLTSLEGRSAVQPHWSPDGSEIYFMMAVFDTAELVTAKIAADGSTPWEQVTTGGATTLTPDGSALLVVRGLDSETLSFARTDSTECWLVPLGDPSGARKLVGGDARYFPTSVSPGGDYLMYGSDRTGVMSAYITRFPEATGRWQVSLDSDVDFSTFAPDGSAIYYTTGGSVYRVAFAEGPTPSLGRPEFVFELPTGARPQIEIDADGGSFLLAQPDVSEEDGDQARGIKVVQNWRSKITGR